jgi:PEGA domain-containing protein
MRYSKPIIVLVATVACTTLLAVDAAAQSRGRSGGRSGGGRSGGGHATVGRAVPRSGGFRVDGPRGGYRSGSRVIVSPRGGYRSGSRIIVSPRVGVRPYRSYYYPYRSRLSLGLGFYSGYPYYGYGYPYSYGYPYAYGYPYGSYAYGYGRYGGYGYSPGVDYGGEVYGGVRIEDAPRDAQVFADGYYAGIVDDFDGPFQRLTLESGPHEIEIRAPGFPPMRFDVNVQPGRTISIHVR